MMPLTVPVSTSRFMASFAQEAIRSAFVKPDSRIEIQLKSAFFCASL
jgi:hypothetical protein